MTAPGTVWAFGVVAQIAGQGARACGPECASDNSVGNLRVGSRWFTGGRCGWTAPRFPARGRRPPARSSDTRCRSVRSCCVARPSGDVPLQTVFGRTRVLSGQHLDLREAGVIIDGHTDALPADAALAAIVVDAIARTGRSFPATCCRSVPTRRVQAARGAARAPPVRALAALLGDPAPRRPPPAIRGMLSHGERSQAPTAAAAGPARRRPTPLVFVWRDTATAAASDSLVAIACRPDGDKHAC